MADEAAATAPAAAPANAAEADPMEATIAAVKARQEAAPADPKGAASTAGSSNSQSKPANTGDAAAGTASDGDRKPRLGGQVAALAKREWEITQKDKAANELKARYAPLDEALAKKDLGAALVHLAKEHGLTLGDFIAAAEMGKPEPKTPEQIAKETVEATLKAEREKEAKERETAVAAEVDAKIAAQRERFATMADAGTAEAPDRWELTAIAGVAGQAWDIIEGHYMQTATFEGGKIVKPGETLTPEQALDLIEAKLKAKRDSRRPKKDDAKAGAAVKRNEASASSGKGGQAREPSFTHRTTSGTGPVDTSDDDEIPASMPDHLAIEHAARKAGIRL